MIAWGLIFFVIGAGAAIALDLVDHLLGVPHRKKCPACQCELGVCRGHGGLAPPYPDGIIDIECPLCRAQGAMVARQLVGPPPAPPAWKDPR